MKEKHLHIPNPCDKNLEDMKKIGSNCHFCTHCSSKVYDFTHFSEEEIWEAFKANNGKICGSIPTIQPATNQWIAWFFSLLAFLGLYSCDNDHNTLGEIMPTEQLEQQHKHPAGKVLPLEHKDSSNTDSLSR